MASTLDKYGIKEVSDVTFYDIDAAGNPTNPALYLDSLKVSTIEETGDEATATGGKGNAPLIVWNYNKEITVNLEDALFSAKSLAIMFGNGKVGSYTGYLMKTEQFVATASGAATAAGWSSIYVAPDGSGYSKINPKFYTETGATVDSTALTKGTTYFCTYDLDVTGSVIEINSNTFPGVYYVVGDTYARSEASGKDEFFQWIVPKGKLQIDNTITLEADGDPTTFNMNLRVLRSANGVMMKLVKYDLDNGTAVDAPEATIVHNHALNPQTT